MSQDVSTSIVCSLSNYQFSKQHCVVYNWDISNNPMLLLTRLTTAPGSLL